MSTERRGLPQLAQIGMWIVASSLLSPLAFGFGEPRHSSVSVETKKSDSGWHFHFKVQPKQDMIVTFDAPWTLELKKHEGLAFAKAKFEKSDLDKDMPGFSAKVTKTPSQPSGEMHYKLVSFICTKDKTRCFREVHQGKAPWKK